MPRDVTLADADAMMVVVEEIVAQARAAAGRIGIDPEAAGLAILAHAYSYAIAEAAGPNADGPRLIRSIEIGADTLVEAVPAYWRLCVKGRAR